MFVYLIATKPVIQVYPSYKLTPGFDLPETAAAPIQFLIPELTAGLNIDEVAVPATPPAFNVLTPDA